MKQTYIVSLLIGALMLGGALPVTADQYLVMAKGNSFSNNLAADIEAAGGTIVYRMDQVGMALVDFASDDAAIAAERIKGIRSVTFDVEAKFIEPISTDAISENHLPEPPFTGDDDVYFDLQWGHDAIDTVGAWDMGHTGAGARVAVLDSGIDPNHPDLAQNVNVFLSTSFVPGETFDVTPGFYFNHGTHVAGTIGAADNAFGVIGVAPDVELVAVKVLSEFTGDGSFGGLYAGMYYAALIDADVVNMSLGSSVPRNCGNGPGSAAKDCAELFAAGNRVANFARQQGTLIIASAGNDGRDMNHDASVKEVPNDLAGVVVVSATAPVGWALDPANTNLDNLASYSNYGTSGVGLSAPGGDFIYPGDEICIGPVVVRPCWVFDLVFSTVPGGWSWSDGTSMAAPHATGVAALIVAANGGDMSPSQLEAALKAGADDLGKPGKDNAYGHGRVNAANSVD
jgi:subtilisin family serine protease